MKKYKLALINPRGIFLGRNKNFVEFCQEFPKVRQNWSGFNTGLLIVAALTPDNFEMNFIDEDFDNFDYENSNFDLVCLSAVSQQAFRAYQIADIFRKKGIKTVMGGIHATVMSAEAKEHVDAVVIGEVEGVWSDLIQDFFDQRLQPFYRAAAVPDPTHIHTPRYDLINPEHYRMLWIQTRRGCPWNCEFCATSNVYGKSYRYKGYDQVINELKQLKDVCKNRGEIGFSDDNMFVNRKYSSELLKRIAPLKIKWHALCDISIGDDDKFLALLRESGCSILFIGFESITESGLQSLAGVNHKIKYVHKYPELIKKIQSYGIGVMGAFIVGLDNDGPEVFEKTANFIKNNHLYAAQVTVLTPYPGTILREKLQKENRILPTDWENYTCFDVNFIPAKMSPEELEQGLISVYRRIYAPDVRVNNATYFKNVYLNLAKRKREDAFSHTTL